MKQKLIFLALMLITTLSISAQRFSGQWAGRIVDDEQPNTLEVSFEPNQELKARITITQVEENITCKFFLNIIGSYETDGTHFAFYIDRNRSNTDYDAKELIEYMKSQNATDDQITEIITIFDTTFKKEGIKILNEIPDNLQLLVTEHTNTTLVVKNADDNTTIELFPIE